MCGRLNVADDPYVQQLLQQLGVAEQASKVAYSRYIRAGQNVSIVLEHNGLREIKSAIWWLLLEQDKTQLKLSRYTSFNSRSDKLTVPKSASYRPFKTQRCIIPAKGFGETCIQGKQKHYYDFISHSAVAFAGIYKLWQHPKSTEPVYSCSVITTSPHAKLAAYHHRSTPLMLNEHEFSAWLNPNEIAESFSLDTKISYPFDVYEMNAPSALKGIHLGTINADNAI